MAAAGWFRSLSLPREARRGLPAFCGKFKHHSSVTAYRVAGTSTSSSLDELIKKLDQGGGLGSSVGKRPMPRAPPASTPPVQPTDRLPDQLFGGQPGASQQIPYAHTLTPEEVVRALISVAGPGVDKPPAEVVGAALKAAGLPASSDNVVRALREAAGSNSPEPTAEEFRAAMIGAENGILQSTDPVGKPAGQAPPANLALKQPEDVVRALMALVGPEAGRPPPEVVGAALKAAGLPATAMNLARALQEAAGPDGPEPTAADLAAAAGAFERGLPPGMEAPAGGATYQQPDVAAPPGDQISPEEAVRLLFQAAGPGAGVPPPEYIGAAIRETGAEISTQAMARALREAARLSGGPLPTQQELSVAMAAALGQDPALGTSQPEGEGGRAR